MSNMSTVISGLQKGREQGFLNGLLVREEEEKE